MRTFDEGFSHCAIPPPPQGLERNQKWYPAEPGNTHTSGASQRKGKKRFVDSSL
jgi:hypothetical protein